MIPTVVPLSLCPDENGYPKKKEKAGNNSDDFNSFFHKKDLHLFLRCRSQSGPIFKTLAGIARTIPGFIGVSFLVLGTSRGSCSILAGPVAETLPILKLVLILKAPASPWPPGPPLAWTARGRAWPARKDPANRTINSFLFISFAPLFFLTITARIVPITGDQ
jgi:hypothetical protein